MAYLQNHAYSYTLSVFIPECGMSNTEPLSREDVITVLHLDKLPIVERLSQPDNGNLNFFRIYFNNDHTKNYHYFNP